MIKKSILVFCTIAMCSENVKSQMKPDAPLYNAPYDTLIVNARKSLALTKHVGVMAFKLACITLNRAIEVNKGRYEAYKLKGDGHLEFKELDDADFLYNKCLEVSPKNPECLYGLFASAATASAKYKTDEVPPLMMSKVYESALAFIAAAPSSMYQEIANAKYTAYYYKLAIDNIEVFKKYTANDVEEPTPDNIKAFEDIVHSIEASGNKFMTSITYDKLINYYFNLKDFAKVKEYGQKVFTSGQGYSGSYFHYATAVFDQDKNAIEALKICDSALKIGPYKDISNLKLRIYYTEGKTAYLAHDYPKAITNLTLHAELTAHKNERGIAYLSFAEYSAKKYAEASINLLVLKAIADPRTVQTYYPNLDVLIAYSLKHVGVAPAVITTITETEKEEMVSEEAIVLLKAKKTDEGLKMILPAIHYFETIKDSVNLSYCYINVAYSFQNTQRYDTAKIYYRKCIAIGALDPSAYDNLSMLLYVVDKNFPDAVTLLNEAEAKFPKNKYIAIRRGKMYCLSGKLLFDEKKYAAAIVDLEKSITYNDEIADAYVFLGFSYYLTNNETKAAEALKSAKELDPEISSQYEGVDQLLKRF